MGFEEGKIEKRLAAALRSRVESGEAAPGAVRAVVGLDGFVDEIVHAVDKRLDADNYTRIEFLRDFAARIASFAEKSGNQEYVTRLKKIGGNGPIMANALNTLGAPVTYIGNLGRPEIDAVFREMASRMEVFSLAEPCHTDALEFNDAKIMFGKMDSIKEITWERILEVVGLERLIEILNGTKLLALVNWSMITNMSDIWERMLEEVFPRMAGGARRFAFFDLADPQKRKEEDVRRMLSLVSRFSEFFDVIFDVNEREAEQVTEIIGGGAAGGAPDRAVAMCERISEELGVYCVVVHPIHYAVARAGGRTYRQEGPTTPRPKITTGAGDHFNAGFCLGQALGADPQTSLLMGVCSSGYYVMNAKSPALDDLLTFMGNWREDPFGMAT